MKVALSLALLVCSLTCAQVSGAALSGYARNHPNAITSIDTVESGRSLLPRIRDSRLAIAPDGGMVLVRTFSFANGSAHKPGTLTATFSDDAQRIKTKLPSNVNPYAFDETKALPGHPHAELTGVAKRVPIMRAEIVVAYYDSSAEEWVIPGSVNVGFVPVAPESEMGALAGLGVENETSLVDQGIKPRKQNDRQGNNTLSKARLWLKLTVSEEGIYRVTAQELERAGFSVSANEIASLALWGVGGEELSERVSDRQANAPAQQPITVRTRPDGSLSEILFYGAPSSGFRVESNSVVRFKNHYTNSISYILSVGGGVAGLRATPQSGEVAEASNMPTWYRHYTLLEEDLYNPYSPGSGLRWFGRRVDASLPATLTTALPNFVAADSVRYSFTLAHASTSVGRFTIEESGSGVGSMQLTGTNLSNYEQAFAATRSFSAPASAIRDARSVLRVQYSNAESPSSSVGYVDYITLQWPRSLAAHNGAISLFTDPALPGVTDYTVSGFSGEIHAVDITNPKQPVWLQNASSTGSVFSYKVNAVQGVRHLFVASSLRAPASMSLVPVTDLKAEFPQSDVVVVTHKSLVESAQAWADYRRSQSGFTVGVVSTDEIYNEFASGNPDITAIRDFLASIYHDRPTAPRYVLAWGDAHYDFRNISTAEVNYVPVWQKLDSDGRFHAVNDTYATDDFIVCVDGDDFIPDYGMGRVPVSSNAQGFAFVDKLRTYERSSTVSPWRRTITFAADDSPTTPTKLPDGVLHTSQSEELAASFVPGELFQRKIYLPMYPTENVPGGRRRPKVTEDLLNAINGGTLLLNWVGHGNPRVWADERVMEKDVFVPQLVNKDRLFFLVAATCDYGRFDDPERSCGAEDMLLSPLGGAVGILTANRTVYSHSNFALAQEFYRRLFPTGGTSRVPMMGDVILGLKTVRSGVNDRKFSLLGDPTMRLLRPNDRVSITEVNNIDVQEKDTTVQLQGLSRATVSGVLYRENSSEIASDFNGSVILHLHDADIARKVLDVDNTVHDVATFGGMLNVGVATVQDGRFTATVVVPKDISFSSNNARILALAVSSDSSRLAAGASRSIVVLGIDATAPEENDGPEIRVWVDDRNFSEGDKVRSNPQLIIDLFDESGINATGTSVGRDIEAWIDDAPMSLILTPNFNVSLTDYRRGTVERQLFNLSPGIHTLRVRAWDIFNNPSVVQTWFRVGETGTIELVSPLAYPNPFAEQVEIRARHTASVPSGNATCSIVSPDGRLIRTLSAPVTSQTLVFRWDGTSNDGSTASDGVYYYRIDMVAPDGTTGRSTGQIQRFAR